MFDHILFDKSGFDNERVFDGARLASFGYLDALGAVIYIPIPDIEIAGYNGIDFVPLFFVPLSAEIDDAEGGIDPDVIFELAIELTARIGGMGEIDLPAIGDLAVTVLELEDIELGQMETITIDSDLMIILFGTEHDVSSLTVESEFFDLGVGHNEIVFEYDFAPAGVTYPIVGGDLDVTIIWENRWL